MLLSSGDEPLSLLLCDELLSLPEDDDDEPDDELSSPQAVSSILTLKSAESAAVKAFLLLFENMIYSSNQAVWLIS